MYLVLSKQWNGIVKFIWTTFYTHSMGIGRFAGLVLGLARSYVRYLTTFVEFNTDSDYTIRCSRGDHGAFWCGAIVYELFHVQLNNTEQRIQVMEECYRKWSIQLCSNTDGTSQCTVKPHTNQYLSFMKMVPQTPYSTDWANSLYPVHTMAWFQFSYERNQTHWWHTIGLEPF